MGLGRGAGVLTSGHAEPLSTPPSTVAPPVEVPGPHRGRPAPPLLGAAALVGAALPIAFLVGLVARLGVNAPYSDEWDLVPLLQRSAAGTLRLSDPGPSTTSTARSSPRRSSWSLPG